MNLSVQPQKMTRGKKFGLGSRGIAKNKGTDQLRGYHTDDLFLCSHICKKQGFS